MILRKSILIFGFLFLSMGATSLAYADFNRGLEAYDRGDYETALTEWLIDAKQGNMLAQYRIGFIYANGEGVPKNKEEALKWYRLAAEQGYARAQYRLGLMYDFGEFVPETETEGARWILLAAEQGYAPAQGQLGFMYGWGEGSTRNRRRGAEMVPPCRRPGISRCSVQSWEQL